MQFKMSGGGVLRLCECEGWRAATPHVECLRLGRRVGDRQNCKLVVGIDVILIAYIWDKQHLKA